MRVELVHDAKRLAGADLKKPLQARAIDGRETGTAKLVDGRAQTLRPLCLSRQSKGSISQANNKAPCFFFASAFALFAPLRENPAYRNTKKRSSGQKPTESITLTPFSNKILPRDKNLSRGCVASRYAIQKEN
jgi:hypothetical protein